MTIMEGEQTTRLEVLQHYGTEGANPIAELGEAFSDRHSGVSVIQTDRPVTTLRLLVKSRMLGENPPDLWVEWPAENLKPAVEAGVVADVTDVWESNGLEAAYVEGAKSAAQVDGRYRCLPLDVYHINNLFGNASLLEEAGVDLKRISDADEFLDTLAVIDDALDVPALTINGKDPFGPLQLWETFLLAYGGREAYDGVIDGRAETFRSTIERAVEAMDTALEYASEDVGFVSSTESDRRFAGGRAAMAHNGGWAVGRLSAVEGFEHGRDWTYTAFPGTEGYYQMNMNAIVLGSHLEGNEVAASLLAYLGSPEALERVSTDLGAVPPRTDVPTDGLHSVTREHTAALEQTAYHAPSMAHGVSVPPNTLVAMKEAIGEFVAARDVSAATDALVRAL